MSLFSNQDIKQLKAAFASLKFKLNYPLSKVTYFKLGGPAEVLVEVEDREELVRLVKYCRQNDHKVTVLGGASNVLVVDEGVSGLVILTRHQTVTEIDSDLSKGSFLADAGIPTALVVKKSVELGYTGLELFLGVPGRLGGAIYNNSHFKTELIGDYVKQVQVLSDKGEVVWLTQEECEFAYDHSRFQNTQEVILQVEFELQKGDAQESQQLMKESTLYRVKTQPLGMPSSGCIFKNVANTDELKKRFPKFSDKQFVPAGFLIDQAGLKRTKVGDIQVSPKHASFMVNLGAGTADQLAELIELVKAKVKEKFGVQLQEEVFWIS